MCALCAVGQGSKPNNAQRSLASNETKTYATNAGLNNCVASCTHTIFVGLMNEHAGILAARFVYVSTTQS